MAQWEKDGLQYGDVGEGVVQVYLSKTCAGLRNGSCERHAYCGSQLRQNDVLVLKHGYESNDGRHLFAYKVEMGRRSCLVGCVREDDLPASGIRYFHLMLVQVTCLFEDEEDFEDMENEERKRLLHNIKLYQGLVLCEKIGLYDAPEQYGAN